MSLPSPGRRSSLLLHVILVIPVIFALGFAVYYSHAAKELRDNRDLATDAFDLRLTVKDLQTATTKLGASEVGEPASPLPVDLADKPVSAREQGYVELARITMSLMSTNSLSPLDRERLQRINTLAQAYITNTRMQGPAPLRRAMLADIEKESELLNNSANQRWRDLNKNANLYRNRLQSNVLSTLILLGLCLVACAAAIFRINKQRHRALELLQTQTERQRAILDRTGEAIFTVSTAGSMLTSNRAATLVFGWDRLTLQGKKLTELLADSGTGERVLGSFKTLQSAQPKEGDVYSGTGIDADGRRFPVEISSTQVTSGNTTDYVVVIADLTHHWRQPADLEPEPAPIDV